MEMQLVVIMSMKFMGNMAAVMVDVINERNEKI
ncbi:hypothetical protein SAMN04490370_10835 [Eubacterium ruminantium]|nr:hypothetical protein SAMN04490370_10835 [Eubacterium ruminantium]